MGVRSPCGDVAPGRLVSARRGGLQAGDRLAGFRKSWKRLPVLKAIDLFNYQSRLKNCLGHN